MSWADVVDWLVNTSPRCNRCDARAGRAHKSDPGLAAFVHPALYRQTPSHEPSIYRLNRRACSVSQVAKVSFPIGPPLGLANGGAEMADQRHKPKDIVASPVRAGSVEKLFLDQV